MGGFLSSIWSKLFGSKEVKVLVLGLDGAGKTTILYWLQSGAIVKTTPTIGFNVESLKIKNVTLQVWDLGGQVSIRPYWKCYYTDTDAVIFVIDSSDTSRLENCKEELQNLLNETELSNAILLVLANKQDLTNSLPASEISQQLNLSSLDKRSWCIYKTSAIKGIGLTEAMEWLVSQIELKK